MTCFTLMEFADFSISENWFSNSVFNSFYFKVWKNVSFKLTNRPLVKIAKRDSKENSLSFEYFLQYLERWSFDVEMFPCGGAGCAQYCFEMGF